MGVIPITMRLSSFQFLLHDGASTPTWLLSAVTAVGTSTIGHWSLRPE
jgi:hypothetical protein